MSPKPTAIPDRGKIGLLFRIYLAVSAIAAPVARLVLKRRLKRGKEDNRRWREKLGFASEERPKGRLVWMHAVGVGEALALPVLIEQMRRDEPDLSVLVTTSVRTAAIALRDKLPNQTVHQFLPLDCKTYASRFLDHWRPDLSIWAERDVWPRLIWECRARNIPMAIVNGRMTQASFEAKNKAGRFFGDVYRQFDWIDVQDETTTTNFKKLGVPAENLRMSGSLKTSGPPLPDQPELRKAWKTKSEGKLVWIAASTHEGEEDIVAHAHKLILQNNPHAVCIIAPRDPTRASVIVDEVQKTGLTACVTDGTQGLDDQASIFVVNTIGQLGLWYRLADWAFIGGTLVPVGGHNLYEAARLTCAIVHGPHVDNFQSDFDLFQDQEAAVLVHDATSLSLTIGQGNGAVLQDKAGQLANRGQMKIAQLSRRLSELIGEM